MSMRQLVGSLFWGSVFSVCAASAAQGQGQAPAMTDSVRQARGKRLYEGKALCFSCHGKEGEGVLGPTTRLSGRTFSHTKAEISQLVELIKTGIDAKRSASSHVMPPRGGSRITDAEVELVAYYVKELNSRKLPR